MMCNTTRLLAMLMCAAFLLGWPRPAPAQPSAAEPPPWINVRILEVDPTKGDEFEALTKELSAAQKKTDMAFKNVWQTVGGKVFEYYIVTPVSKLGDLDKTQPFFEEAEGAAWIRRIAKTEKSHTRHVSRTFPELSIPIDDLSGKMGVLRIRRVKSGRNDEYRELLEKEVVPAFKKGGVEGYFVSRVRYGGHPDWTSLSIISNWADLEGEGPLTRALGQDKAQDLIGRLSDLTVEIQWLVLRHRPDLSF